MNKREFPFWMYWYSNPPKMSTPQKEAERAKKPQKIKILELMQDGKFHSAKELHEICWRYGARLHDLKKDGYELEKKRIKGSLWAWRLKDNNTESTQEAGIAP